MPFLPKSYSLANVGLQKWIMGTKVPHEFEGAYDNIHVLNVVSVSSDEEIVAIASKLFKHLGMIDNA